MRTKCRSIATFHRPIHSHWSLPLNNEWKQFLIVLLFIYSMYDPHCSLLRCFQRKPFRVEAQTSTPTLILHSPPPLSHTPPSQVFFSHWSQHRHVRIKWFYRCNESLSCKIFNLAAHSLRSIISFISPPTAQIPAVKCTLYNRGFSRGVLQDTVPKISSMYSQKWNCAV